MIRQHRWPTIAIRGRRCLCRKGVPLPRRHDGSKIRVEPGVTLPQILLSSRAI